MKHYYRTLLSIGAVTAICALLVHAVSCSQDPCNPVEKFRTETAIYSDDFSASPGDEWSVSKRETSPSGVQFLGRFANEGAQLSLSGLPSHTSLTLTFKLYIIHSWDGNDGDQWKCSVSNGPTLLMESFSNTDDTQSYPHAGCSCPAKTGAVAVDSLDFEGRYSGYGDAIYEIAVTFPHSASSIVIEFQGLVDEVVENESWGIDDVYLWKGPSTFPTE